MTILLKVTLSYDEIIEAIQNYVKIKKHVSKDLFVESIKYTEKDREGLLQIKEAEIVFKEC